MDSILLSKAQVDVISNEIVTFDGGITHALVTPGGHFATDLTVALLDARGTNIKSLVVSASGAVTDRY